MNGEDLGWKHRSRGGRGRQWKPGLQPRLEEGPQGLVLAFLPVLTDFLLTGCESTSVVGAGRGLGVFNAGIPWTSREIWVISTLTWKLPLCVGVLVLKLVHKFFDHFPLEQQELLCLPFDVGGIW